MIRMIGMFGAHNKKVAREKTKKRRTKLPYANIVSANEDRPVVS
jgi:hypothetical protein